MTIYLVYDIDGNLVGSFITKRLARRLQRQHPTHIILTEAV